MTDRGISQSLGFVLILGVIVVSIGVVAIVGFDQLETFREGQELQNAERSLLLVKENVDEIQDGRALARSGDLDLDRGRMDLIPAAESRIRIQVEGTTGPSKGYNETLVMSGVRYQLGGATVGYESGAVFRSGEQSDAAMQATPSFVCTADRALLAVVTVDGERKRQISGGTAALTVERNATSVEFPLNRTGVNSTEGRANVTVEVVDSPFKPGWERYFSDHEDWQGRGGGEYVCSPSGDGVSSVQVVRTRVNVSFIR